VKQTVIILVLVLVWSRSHAETNSSPATALLLDDKTAFELTTGLTQYERPPRLAGKLRSVGSAVTTILVSRWAAEFGPLYPEVELDIRAPGSQEGVSQLLEGKADIVPSGRPLSAQERARFKEKFGHEPTEIIVAQDALGVYVNKNNPIIGLSLDQLEAIYSVKPNLRAGRPEFWGDVGVTGPLARKQINQVSLNRWHDVQLYFRDLVMKGEEYRFDVSFELVPSSVVQAAGADEAAISMASIMLATARTRFVPLQGSDGQFYLPSYENTWKGLYPLNRPMRIVFNRKPDGAMSPVAREFLRFAVSRRGQRIIALAGSYPIPVELQKTALGLIGENR
jgi:phosphate transport system substrate-binding protein